jgi:hypothetical protein
LLVLNKRRGSVSSHHVEQAFNFVLAASSEEGAESANSANFGEHDLSVENEDRGEGCWCVDQILVPNSQAILLSAEAPWLFEYVSDRSRFVEREREEEGMD